LRARDNYLNEGRLLGALSRDALKERSSSQFEKCRDLLMNESGAAVFFASVDRGGIVDVKTPLADVVWEVFDESRYDRGRYGFYRISLKDKGLGEELACKKDRMSAQKGDIDTCKLYHPGGKLGTLTALR
jgi:hypothetical protein